MLGSDLGVGPRSQVGEGDVVDRHLDVLGRSPVLGVLVEPDVVGRDKVAPLQDLESLLRTLDPESGTQSGCHGRSGRRGHELAPVDSLTLGHGRSSVCAAPSAVHGGTKSLRGSVAARCHGGTAGATYGSV